MSDLLPAAWLHEMLNRDRAIDLALRYADEEVYCTARF